MPLDAPFDGVFALGTPGQLVQFPAFQPSTEELGLGGLGGNSDNLPAETLWPVTRLGYLYSGQDDVPAGNMYGLPDEDFYSPVIPGPVVNGKLYLFTTDEPSPVPLGPDEDFVVLSGQQQPVNTRLVVQDEGEFTRVGIIDEDFWVAPVPCLNVVNIPQGWFYDPSDLVTLAAEEDYYWVVVPKFDVKVPKVIADEGEITLVGKVDEDLWYVATKQPIYTPQQPIGEQADAVWLAAEEDYYWYARTTVPVPYIPLITDEGEFTLFGPAEEDYWFIGKQVVYPQPLQPTTDQGDLVFLASEEDYWWNWLVRNVAIPTIQPVSDEGEFTNVAKIDEDYWSVPSPQPVITNRLTTYDEGETTFGVRGDEEYWWTWLVRSLIPTVNPITDEGELTFVGPVDEDFYVVPKQQVPTNRVLGFADDDFASYSLDEDFWVVNKQQQYPVVLLPVFDNEYPIQVVIDEDYNWVGLVVPSTNVLPQIYKWEQHEQATGLFGTYDEDYWSVYRPVPGVVSIQTPAVQDENTRPITLQGDEDYWLSWLNVAKQTLVSQQAFYDRTETFAYQVLYITRMNDWLDLAALHRSVT